MDKFVARENIRHFRDRLETETDPTNRTLLHELLIQEEDKLGHNSEALQQIDNLIACAKGHVARQLASIEGNGHDTTQALALLNAYSKTLMVCENQRKKILSKLHQSRL
jgi:hypothetical protein